MTRRRKMRIAVVGLPYFASGAAEELHAAGMDARYAPRPGRDLRATARGITTVARADVIYAIGSDIASNSLLDLLARLRKPILVHWVGSDVTHALRLHEQGRVSSRLRTAARHSADAPWLADELRPLGIDARTMPVPSAIAAGVPLPLPAEFRVLLYLPAAAHPAYDVDAMLRCVDALPGIRFVAVGGYTPPVPRENLEVLGYVEDMRPVYARASAFLRLMHHDGLSHSVIEALSYGRHVVWTYPWPGVIPAATVTAAIEALEDLAARHERGALEVNAAADQVREQFAPLRLVRQVRAELRAVVLAGDQ